MAAVTRFRADQNRVADLNPGAGLRGGEGKLGGDYARKVVEQLEQRSNDFVDAVGNIVVPEDGAAVPGLRNRSRQAAITTTMGAHQVINFVRKVCRVFFSSMTRFKIKERCTMT